MLISLSYYRPAGLGQDVNIHKDRASPRVKRMSMGALTHVWRSQKKLITPAQLFQNPVSPSNWNRATKSKPCKWRETMQKWFYWNFSTVCIHTDRDWGTGKGLQLSSSIYFPVTALGRALHLLWNPLGHAENWEKVGRDSSWLWHWSPGPLTHGVPRDPCVDVQLCFSSRAELDA